MIEQYIPANIRTAFFNKLNAIAAEFTGVTANDFMLVMFKESGINPQKVNKQTASVPGRDENRNIVKPEGTPDSDNAYVRAKYRATGLIQFMPTTAKDLGTSTQALYNMNHVQQLDYVAKYYRKHKSRIKSPIDLYMVTFYPTSAGKPDSHIVGSENGDQNKVARYNIALAKTNGLVSIRDIKNYFFSNAPAFYANAVVQTVKNNPKSSIAGFTLLTIGALAVVYRKPLKQKITKLLAA